MEEATKREIACARRTFAAIRTIRRGQRPATRRAGPRLGDRHTSILPPPRAAYHMWAMDNRSNRDGPPPCLNGASSFINCLTTEYTALRTTLLKLYGANGFFLRSQPLVKA